MTSDRIRRAAEILREEARTKKWMYTDTKGCWLSAPDRNRHDEMLSLSVELDMLAGDRNK